MKPFDGRITTSLAAGLIISLTFAGCGSTVLYKDGATQADFNRDAYECQRDVYAASGPRYRPIDAGPNPYVYPLTDLGEQLNRMGFERQIFEQCMRSRGYRTGQ